MTHETPARVAATVAARLAQTTARRRIVHRYARLSPKGRPVTCGPHGKRKTVFNTRADAEAAAAAMTRDLGYPPMTAYPCERSRHGHHHLTSEQYPADPGRGPAAPDPA